MRTNAKLMSVHVWSFIYIVWLSYMPNIVNKCDWHWCWEKISTIFHDQWPNFNMRQHNAIQPRVMQFNMWDPLGGSFNRKLLETEVKNRNNIHSGKQMSREGKVTIVYLHNLKTYKTFEMAIWKIKISWTYVNITRK